MARTSTPKAPKLPVKVARLRAYVAALASDAAFTVAVEWRDSRTWGSNPQVYDFGGDPCLDISGTGYNKASAALAEVAAALPDLTPEERSRVARLAGTGVSSVVNALPMITGARWTVAEERCGGNVSLYRFKKLAPQLHGWIFNHYGRAIRPATAEEHARAAVAGVEERAKRAAREARGERVNFNATTDREGRIETPEESYAYVLPTPIEVPEESRPHALPSPESVEG